MRSDMYLKLVLTCLDYSTAEWGSRNLLGKALKDGSETSRLYATRFIGVLVRSKTPNVGQWGIELLVSLAKKSCSKFVNFFIDLLIKLVELQQQCNCDS